MTAAPGVVAAQSTTPVAPIAARMSPLGVTDAGPLHDSGGNRRRRAIDAGGATVATSGTSPGPSESKRSKTALRIAVQFEGAGSTLPDAFALNAATVNVVRPVPLS